ncbi:dTDP-4-dehydrorhamnose reductase [Actinotalea fermentans]|uniref:dTDP-4-dehydrorhamnose reductase n=1 Tax=Actinotalea fermentans TaxID=43671 RepID=A0A511YSU9_9CELL|nr:dTDP-4-dehydrorhamnose reductase [Actinotalea fermentans]KGM14960.1 dTDP-4-dehydrorhamnose reductase [Actinotalea fermentans ATCC 43279 = JCM 9966 = DSM 3133]GEN78269.1 NAD(P)-dependent oxidoreductase [Actinotalea fermentans]
MRWFVVGAQGMLGHDMVAALRSRDHEVTAVDRDEVDITDPGAVMEAVGGHAVVVNCAAWTAVDAAEEQEAAAFAVNAVGPANLGRAAARHGARIVQISTDYVFDGAATTPYAEGTPIAPRSAYGRTKAAGEWAVRAEAPDHLIIRTAWLYGAQGSSFPKTIARIYAERGTVAVVADEVGQPTWSADLADLVVRMIDAGAPAGTYHGTSAGRASWFDFARAVVTTAGGDPALVTATTSAAFGRAAARPPFSVLDHGALVAADVAPIGDWAQRWAVAGPLVLGA